MIIYKFSQIYFKMLLKFQGFHICPYFCSSFHGCLVISNFMIYHLSKVTKEILDPCCYLVAETGSWFILIPISCEFKAVKFYFMCIIQIFKKRAKLRLIKSGLRGLQELRHPRKEKLPNQFLRRCYDTRGHWTSPIVSLFLVLILQRFTVVCWMPFSIKVNETWHLSA